MAKARKIALVTGGSRGLGKNMALSLASNGLDIILTYNSKKEEAEKVAAEITRLGGKAAIHQLDVSDSKKYDSFFAEVKETLSSVFGTDKIDFLVNNAGIGTYVPFAETTEEQFDTLFNIHLKATFFVTQKALGVLRDGGGIVNLSTGLARFSTPGYSAYAAMKGGIETLTRYQAKELGGRGIRVNVLAPGAIETDFGGGVVRDNEQMNKYIASQTALGRVGLPDDIGGVVSFLCSDAARWISGQRLEASGGMYL
ncbi:MAG: SDR family oxidoreductase [Chitinophagaceae bacterium]|nr:MAG: SDR family oxidoreductase [Chitinophagaceae bacterium]